MLTNIVCRRQKQTAKNLLYSLNSKKKKASTLLQKLSQFIASKWDLLETLFMWTYSLILTGGLDHTTFKKSLPTRTILQLLHRSRTCQLSTPSFPLLRKDNTKPWKSGSDKSQMHTAKHLTTGELCEDVRVLLFIKVLYRLMSQYLHTSIPVPSSAALEAPITCVMRLPLCEWVDSSTEEGKSCMFRKFQRSQWALPERSAYYLNIRR